MTDSKLVGSHRCPECDHDCDAVQGALTDSLNRFVVLEAELMAEGYRLLGQEPAHD